MTPRCPRCGSRLYRDADNDLSCSLGAKTEGDVCGPALGEPSCSICSPKISPVSLAVPLSSTRTAFSPVVVKQRVLRCVFMTVRTVGGKNTPNPAPLIFTRSNSLQVRGIDAITDAAKVIDNEAGFNGAKVKLIGESVSQYSELTDVDCAGLIRVLLMTPKPTWPEMGSECRHWPVFVDLIPEANDGVGTRILPGHWKLTPSDVMGQDGDTSLPSYFTLNLPVNKPFIQCCRICKRQRESERMARKAVAG